MIAVLDTNVIVQSLIGSPQATSARVVSALKAGKFTAAFSPATLDELVAVLLLPRIQQRHGLTADEILDVVVTLSDHALFETREEEFAISPNVTRDLTDTKFLAAAIAAHAEFLVTNDRRHLLRLQSYEGIRIVAPAEFLNHL